LTTALVTDSFVAAGLAAACVIVVMSIFYKRLDAKQRP
jgi:hypothetical protein